MDREDELIRLALFGSPVEHSLSPRIHHLFAEQAGLPIEYRAIAASAESLADELRALAAAGGRGCNVTVPLKSVAYDLARHHSERARRARAANTLVFQGANAWRAEMTDGVGLLRDLQDNLSLAVAGRRILLLGAGGAASGVLHDLLAASPARIEICNRHPARAAALVRRFAAGGILAGLDLAQASAAGCDLVINATSAGHRGQLPILPAGLEGFDGTLYDMNYGLAAEPLRQWCAQQGLNYVDGLGMLVEQAAASFHLWTGFQAATRPVIDRLRTAASAA